MSVTQSSPLLSPEQIALRAGQQVPFLRMPQRSAVFADRALRLRQLAAGHAMRDFLLFAAQVAEAQQHVLDSYPPVSLPTPAQMQDAAQACEPPLAAERWARDAQWRLGLSRMLEKLEQRVEAETLKGAIRQLRARPQDYLEAQADRILAGLSVGIDVAAAPLIAAALQVYWTHLVVAADQAYRDTPQGAFDRTTNASLCPCCGSRPVASITRIGGDEGGYRYLQCALCSTQWHMVRIKCTHCETTKGIQYQALQRADDVSATGRDAGASLVNVAVQAETCTECGHYLKIMHMNKDAHVDAVADDLATLALDLLVTEAGLQPHGVNLMLFFSDSAGLPDPERP